MLTKTNICSVQNFLEGTLNTNFVAGRLNPNWNVQLEAHKPSTCTLIAWSRKAT